MNIPRWLSRRGRDTADRDLNDEIRAHIEMDVAARIARGEQRDEALAAARREFGNLAHVKEVTRETWGAMWLERLVQDVRYGARSLARTPAFAATSIATLGLGIGVTTAMFTVVRGVLLRPLPFAAPEQLYLVSHMSERVAQVFGDGMPEHEYDDYARAARAWRSTFAYRRFPSTLLDAGDPTRISVAAVSANFFSTLGIPPRYGQPFAPSDEAPGSPPSVILGARLWRDRFGADSSVVGRSVRIDGYRATIVGVMPDGFVFPRQVDAWVPLVRSTDTHNTRMQTVIGRLAPGATGGGALAELRQFVRGRESQAPQAEREHERTVVVPLRDAIVGDVRTPLLLFGAAIALVLLIACANVSNLMAMRATARRQELGVRAALGASRSRLVRQLLTESVLVATVGGALGLIIASLGVRGLLAAMPPGLLPRASEIHVDPVVVTLALALCVASGILAGTAPAVAALSQDVRDAIADSARVTTRSPLQRTLVTVEGALSLVLLIGAGLMIRSFARLRQVDLGFTPEHIITATIDLPDTRYKTADLVHDAVSRMEDRIAAIPGVRGAAAVNWLPFDSTYITGDFERADGRTLPPGYTVLKPFVTPGYFETMGIHILAGRAFEPSDRDGAEAVAIVSEAVARALWPNGAIGQRISYTDKPTASDWITIVGVAADVSRSGPADAPKPAIYRPVAQTSQIFFINHLTFVARTDGDPDAAVSLFRAAVRSVDPEQPIRSIASMESHVRDAVAEPRFRSIITSVFSALALLIAGIGIYGALAYAVSQRRRELGIRIALGATPGRAAWLVVRTMTGLVAPGIVVGLIVAFIATRLMARFLFQIQANDPVSYLSASSVLIGAALIASIAPAWRAAKTDPLSTMK
jgi:predicted permease